MGAMLSLKLSPVVARFYYVWTDMPGRGLAKGNLRKVRIDISNFPLELPRNDMSHGSHPVCLMRVSGLWYPEIKNHGPVGQVVGCLRWQGSDVP